MKNIRAVDVYPSLIVIFISLIFFQSCSEDTIINPDTRQQYELKAWDYFDRHYFWDTVYKESFLDWFNNISLTFQTVNLVVDDQSFEVWVQTDVLTSHYRKAGLHVDLPVLPAGGYNDSKISQS